jgi:hypothetical protein
MPLFCGQNLTDHFPPPHQRTFLAAEYATTDIDLTNVTAVALGATAAQAAPPKNPACMLLILFAANTQELTLETYGGQRVKHGVSGSTPVGFLTVRGAYTKIIAENNALTPTGSDAVSVTVFWE